VKTMLCNFCIKSGILCANCQEKVRSGQVTETDIAISRLLLKLEERYPSIQKIDFRGAHEADNVLAIVVGDGDSQRILAEGGKIIREISESTGKKVRLFERKGDTRRFLEELFFPVSITTINKIWLPDGSQETRVILSGRSRRLPLKTDVLQALAKRVRGITLRIAFENQLEEEYF
jgi:transcription antitermination factor NusA-like protein